MDTQFPAVIRDLFAKHGIFDSDAETLWAGFVRYPEAQASARAASIFASYARTPI